MNMKENKEFNTWTDVKEKLPEDMMEVLFKPEHPRFSTVIYSEDVGFGMDGRDVKVTHWKYLK